MSDIEDQIWLDAEECVPGENIDFDSYLAAAGCERDNDEGFFCCVVVVFGLFVCLFVCLFFPLVFTLILSKCDACRREIRTFI